MRALQVIKLTGPDGVRLTEVPEPAVGGGLLVEVHAVGVNYPDLLRSQGLYQEKRDPPYILGDEVAGVVLEAPAGSAFAPGERVAGWARGAAADRVAGSAETFVRLPASFDFEAGAALMLNYETAIFALGIRGRISPGDVVLVHGAAGGTGTAALQVAKALGGRTIAVVSSDVKEAVARRAGADEVVRSDGPWKDDAVRLTAGRGVNIVFDPVGGDRMLDTIRVLATGGRWLVIGFVGGAIPQIPANRLLLKNIDVVGSYFGGFLETQPGGRQLIDRRLAELLDGGHIRPIVGPVHELADGAEALRDLAERRAIGKVVIKVR